MAINDVSTKPSLQQAPKAESVSRVIADSKVDNTNDKPTTSVSAVIAKQLDKKQEAEQSQANEVDRDDLEVKVAQLNDYMQTLNRSLQFQVDEQSGDTIIKVIDSETEETVRQIPSQEVLDARNAVDKYKGILLEAKV